MVSRAVEIESARSAILSAVPQLGGEPSPVSLIKYLVTKGTPEDLARTVLWYLIDQKELGLSRDWAVRVLSENGHQADDDAH